DDNTAMMFLSAFTVTTEAYPLSRRLYLYASASPKRRAALDFIGFALSSEGQQVVRQAGFIDLDVGFANERACDHHCPKRYAALVAGARRLSVDLRFRSGTSDLDSRAVRDIERILLFLRGHAGVRVLLFGFADKAGHGDANVALSRQRARA